MAMPAVGAILGSVARATGRAVTSNTAQTILAAGGMNKVPAAQRSYDFLKDSLIARNKPASKDDPGLKPSTDKSKAPSLGDLFRAKVTEKIGAAMRKKLGIPEAVKAPTVAGPQKAPKVPKAKPATPSRVSEPQPIYGKGGGSGDSGILRVISTDIKDIKAGIELLVEEGIKYDKPKLQSTSDNKSKAEGDEQANQNRVEAARLKAANNPVVSILRIISTDIKDIKAGVELLVEEGIKYGDGTEKKKGGIGGMITALLGAMGTKLAAVAKTGLAPVAAKLSSSLMKTSGRITAALGRGIAPVTKAMSGLAPKLTNFARTALTSSRGLLAKGAAAARASGAAQAATKASVIGSLATRGKTLATGALTGARTLVGNATSGVAKLATTAGAKAAPILSKAGALAGAAAPAMSRVAGAAAPAMGRVAGAAKGILPAAGKLAGGAGKLLGKAAPGIAIGAAGYDIARNGANVKNVGDLAAGGAMMAGPVGVAGSMGWTAGRLIDEQVLDKTETGRKGKLKLSQGINKVANVFGMGVEDHEDQAARMKKLDEDGKRMIAEAKAKRAAREAATAAGVVTATGGSGGGGGTGTLAPAPAKASLTTPAPPVKGEASTMAQLNATLRLMYEEMTSPYKGIYVKESPYKSLSEQGKTAPSNSQVEPRAQTTQGQTESGVYDESQSSLEGVTYKDQPGDMEQGFGEIPESLRARGTGGGELAPVSPNGMSASEGLGSLSARYESGKRGSSAVGWDRTGGTSYGKYQIASRTGTMDKFMSYLQKNNPEAYEQLAAAGPADGGKNGKFAETWKNLASSGKLGTSEHDFIKESHYDVSMRGIKSKGLKGMMGSSKALQDVMWSTSVQHGGGGGAGIFNKAYKDGMSEQDLIDAVYKERGTRFGSSDAGTRASVLNRFGDERKQALSMVGAPSDNRALTAQAEAPLSKPLNRMAGAQPAISTAMRESVADKERTRRTPIVVAQQPPVSQQTAAPIRNSAGSGVGSNVPVIVRTPDHPIQAYSRFLIAMSA